MRHRRTRSSLLVVLLSVLTILITASPAAADAELSITKVGPATVTAGDDVSYAISVTNGGADDASATSVQDALPAGMTFVSLTQDSGPAFVCATPGVGDGGTVECTIAVLPAGSTATFTLVANAPLDLAGTTVTNTATVSSPDDNTGDDNSSSASTDVLAQPDLSILKTGPETAEAGDALTYTIDVTNNGPSDATNVEITDNLPPETTFASVTQDSGPAFSCTTPVVGTNGSVSCTIASMAATVSASFTLVVDVDPATEPGFVTNVASVGADADTNEENNSSTAVTVVGTLRSADVGVQKTGPGFAAADSDVTYTITVTSGGPDDAENVALTDTLPGTMTFVSIEQDPSSTPFSCVTPAVGAGGTVTCTLASFPEGETATFTLVGHVPDGEPSGTEFTNQAVVTSDDDDTSENDTATTTFYVAEADLAVSKSGPATADAGDEITYTLSTTNNGPDATGATVTDELPADTTFVSLTQTSGPAFTATTPAVGSTGTVYLSNGAFLSGETATFTLVVEIDELAPTSSMTNTATVAGEAPDPNGGNDESSVTTAVTRLPSGDLSVDKAGPATIGRGSQLTYTLTVANAGPDTQTSVTVTDALPASTTFVSLTQDSGPTFTCATPAEGEGGTVTCTLASFASDASATFTLVALVDPAAAAGSTVANTATVTGGLRDGDASDDSDTVLTDIVRSSRTHRRADLGITTSFTDSRIDVGDRTTFVMRVHNEGPSSAAAVSVRTLLPPGFELVDADVRGDTCDTEWKLTRLRVTCDLGTVGAGSTRTVRLELQVTKPGRFAVLAGVRSPTQDLRRSDQYDHDRLLVEA